MHEHSSFVTLTYREEVVPHSLVLRDLQLFHKRLRKLVGKYRHFSCGEYGGKKGRAHFHAIVFGYFFSDRYFWKLSERGLPVYRSPTLEKAWPHGFSSLGEVTPATAQYVAQYTTKKLSPVHAAQCRKEGRRPEFAVMSMRPGIGASWIDKFASSVFPADAVVGFNKQPTKVPPYYLKRQPEAMQQVVKAVRRARSEEARAAFLASMKHPDKAEIHRRWAVAVGERSSHIAAELQRIKTSHSERSYENETARLRDS